MSHQPKDRGPPPVASSVVSLLGPVAGGAKAPSGHAGPVAAPPAGAPDDAGSGTIPEKAYLLVARLAFAPHFAVEREEMRFFLWPDVRPDRRPGNLRQLLLRLGRAEGCAGLVVSENNLLRLAGDPMRLDAIRLAAAAGGARLPPDDLLALMDGELLGGISAVGEEAENWLAAARREVADQRVAVITRVLGEDRGELGAHRRLALAARLVEIDPGEEIGHRTLVEEHLGLGDERQARKAWAYCIEALGRDFGIAPGPGLASMAARLGIGGAIRRPALPAAAPIRFDASPAARPVRPPSLADVVGAPRLVVMPPVSAGGDLLSRLGLALLEDVTVGLSQVRAFKVVAAHTSVEMERRGIVPSAGAQGDPLAFDYAVTVGARESGGECLARCVLTRLTDGELLWAVELPFTAEAAAASLDRLVRRIVSSLAVVIERVESLVPADDEGVSAYRLYLEGKRLLGGTHLERIRQARRWFRAAARRCDAFSAAHAGVSRSLSMEWLVRGMTDGSLLDEASREAWRARECDPSAGRGLRELGFVSLYLRRHGDSLDFYREARALAPHDADLLADYADALIHDGQNDAALDMIAAARELNPIPPDFYRWVEGSVRYQREEYAEAVETLLPASGSPATARLLAASMAMAGDRSGARRFAEVVRENYPEFRVDDVWRIVPDRRPADTRQLVEGLRLAGLD